MWPPRGERGPLFPARGVGGCGAGLCEITTAGREQQLPRGLSGLPKGKCVPTVRANGSGACRRTQVIFVDAATMSHPMLVSGIRNIENTHRLRLQRGSGLFVGCL